MAGKMFEIAFNILGKVNNSFSSAFTGAADHMSKLSTRVSGLQSRMKELEKQQKNGTTYTREQAEAYKKLADELVKAEAAQRKYAKVMALQKTADKMQSTGKNIATGSAAIGGALFTGPVMASVNFETAMAGVAKQVDGARSETGELTAIGQQAQQDIFRLSKELMKAPVDVANAYSLGARAGVKGAENIAKITEMGIMMGTAFEMPAEQITTQMAKIGNALGYNLETAKGIAQLEALADKINYVDDQTLATGPDLIDFMNRTAGAIKALAPTMSEGMTIGLGGGLLAAGERAEVAGTAINAMLTKFAAAPTQSEKFQRALEYIGMSAEELQSGIIDNADKAMLGLFERINQLDQASRNNVMAELIGQEHIDTVAKLTGNYDKFLDSIKLANDEAAKGSVRKEFDVMSKTTARQFEGVQAALMRTFIIIGNNLLPVIKSASTSLSVFLEGVQAFTAKYPNLTNALVVGSAAALAFGVVVGGLVWVLGGVAGSVLSLVNLLTKVQVGARLAAAGTWLWTTAQQAWNITMVVGRGLMVAGWYAAMAARYVAMATLTGAWTAAQWLWNAAMLANPIGLVIAGIALLIGAGYLLINNWDTVKEWFITLWDNPKLALQQFTDGIYSKFGGMFRWLGEKWAWVKSIFSQPISANVSASAGGEARVYENAVGGIYSKGAFLTTFAEQSPEAAIPLDGSPRALSLWSQAGEILGVQPAGGGISINAPFSPVLNISSNTDAPEIQRVLEDEREKFRRMLDSVLAETRRLSYG